MIKEEILSKLQKIVKELTNDGSVSSPQGEFAIILSTPADASHGDYTTNVAFSLAKKLGKSPLQVAEEIVSKFRVDSSQVSVNALKPGFINFHISQKFLINHLQDLLTDEKKVGMTTKFKGQRIMVEYAHPNTHKEAHIGHTRTLMTGEAIARILQANGATVFRANYQGDVGPHVAKALYGVNKALEEGLSLSEIETWDHFKKVHFLGQAYARGNRDYEDHKEEIDAINKLIYTHGEGNKHLWELYQITRKWSLEYYEDLYKRFGVKFDRLFFETEMAEDGPKIVRKYIGSVFVQDPDGSVIFPGEKYGLHTRVFITKAGTPTYEGKEMANAFKEAQEFPFDKKIHVVGSEQEGYFKVVFKALDLIDPGKFVGKQVHLPTGIIQLKDRKMSSRTGDVLTYSQLIDEIKANIDSLFTTRKLSEKEKEEVKEQVALGAIKYSVLKVGTRQNVAFDIQKSVSLDGDSGPYLQYTYARTQSILEKSDKTQIELRESEKEFHLNMEELALLRQIYQFSDILEQAAEDLAPSTLCTYLYELAKAFNLFYQKHRILDSDSTQIGLRESDVSDTPASRVPSEFYPNIRQFRLALTQSVGLVLARGLNILGIEAPKRM